MRLRLATLMLAPAPPKIVSGASPDLDKHDRAIALTHNQVYFATASPRCAVITGKQGEALVEQIPQGALLGSIAALLGVGFRERGVHWFNVLIPHWWQRTMPALRNRIRQLACMWWPRRLAIWQT